MRTCITRVVLATTILFASASLAQAVDGVIEINQARAVAGGVTSADDPGFPVTIGTAGSYRLTGNLSTTAASVPVVQITADDVTLDLNGFRISCSSRGFPPEPCTLDNAGIRADTDFTRIAVRNGTINGVGGYGIFLIGTHNTVENVRIFSAGRDGLALGSYCIVDKVISTDNGDDGIDVADWCSVSNSVVDENGETGIEGGDGARLFGNVARNNASGGIDVDAHAVVHSNVAHGNTGSGIVAAGVVTQNVANSNTQTGVAGALSVIASNQASGNNTGITGTGAVIVGNVATGNTSFGLSAPTVFGIPVGAYIDNALSGNNGGNPEVSGGIELGQNACNGSLTCP